MHYKVLPILTTAGSFQILSSAMAGASSFFSGTKIDNPHAVEGIVYIGLASSVGSSDPRPAFILDMYRSYDGNIWVQDTAFGTKLATTVANYAYKITQMSPYMRANWKIRGHRGDLVASGLNVTPYVKLRAFIELKEYYD